MVKLGDIEAFMNDAREYLAKGDSV